MLQAPTTMLNALAELTRLHDRDALSLSLCITLQEIFEFNQLDLYHYRPAPIQNDSAWQIKRTIHLADGQISQSWHWHENEIISNLSPELDPLIIQALSSKEAIALAIDDCRVVRCLCTSNQPQLLIDCRSTTALSAKDLHVLHGMARIYENHSTLLDYGQTDTLTGLLNRKTLEQQFSKVMAHQKNLNNPEHSAATIEYERRLDPNEEVYFLAVMDIDHFKRINDQFGHVYGDEVLLLIAQLMKASFRSEDHLFRFGGEEFVIMIGPQSEHSAIHAVERFRERVAQFAFPQVGQVTISIGITRLLDFEILSTVLGRADEALYQAKDQGRNRVVSAAVDANSIKAHSPNNGSIELF
ncbi:GGDEF domain-containing protein [Deefgea sp. CFH1-16]|uniref:GGDEF domain-containing protein n=1 Tax=Deefgea sp. CFH1-16 TaxID=2675457 RepID=UPI0015F467F3|nr:GGDEF domain-containing protein [Deefgea sp. CFH1-16]MBM5574795.1 diguanylate cyclase [Deefgea sp. CFH1-16]